MWHRLALPLLMLVLPMPSWPCVQMHVSGTEMKARCPSAKLLVLVLGELLLSWAWRTAGAQG